MKRIKEKSIKNKVAADTLKQRSADADLRKLKESQQRRREAFKMKYDKIRNWEPSKDSNMNTFFSIPKWLIENATLSLNELAVYPVICASANFKNESWNQLSLETIKEKTGLSISTVRKAIEGLCNMTFNDETKGGKKQVVHLLERQKQTEGQRTFWLYKPWFIRQVEIETYKGKQFFFYSYIVEAGIWRNLHLRAKALYLAMRTASEFDFQTYCDAEDIQYHEFSSEIIYRERKWEVCKRPLTQLCGMVGMSNSNIQDVVKSLIRYGLIEPIDGGYIVFQITNIVGV